MRSYGSVRGAISDGRPYRVTLLSAIGGNRPTKLFGNFVCLNGQDAVSDCIGPLVNDEPNTSARLVPRYFDHNSCDLTHGYLKLAFPPQGRSLTDYCGHYEGLGMLGRMCCESLVGANVLRDAGVGGSPLVHLFSTRRAWSELGRFASMAFVRMWLVNSDRRTTSWKTHSQ
jgi:hypothetical protein